MADEVIWTDLRGLNSADPPTGLGPSGATDIHNVLLEPLSLGRRRPSCETISLSSGPSAQVYQLARFQVGADTSASQLFAFSGTSPALHRRSAGTWSSVTLSDTVASFSASRPQAVTHNGKLFIAYNSDVNRLHVYDPAYSASALRRVGLDTPGASNGVTNDGSGSYTAKLRYYRIQLKTKNGSDTVCSSELGPVTSFTPSGTGTSAVIAAPASTEAHATHFVVFGSVDNNYFYDISGDILIATSTYTDSADPLDYSANAIAPTVGLNVPPPAAKYLISDGNRLLMAGAWETTATSSQTGVRNSRVWFTAVNGARDNTGEDESIPQTSALKYWIDCGENDGDAIVGLGGPMDGIVYVFKQRSIWRLVPSGLDDSPYRAERVSSALGAAWQDAIALGEDGQGRPALYFQSLTGPKRIAPGMGIEDLGADVRAFGDATYSSVDDTPLVVWDQVRRVVWWLTYNAQTAYAFQPQFESRTRDGVRGGWTRHTLQNGGTANLSCALYEISSVLVPCIGGAQSTTGYIASLSGTSRLDVSSPSIAATITSGIFQPAGLLRRVHLRNPILEWDYPGAATAPTVSISSVIGGPIAVTGAAVSDTVTGSTYSTAVVQEKLETIQLSDVSGFQITLTWDTAVSGSERPRMHHITIPWTRQEAA